MKEIATIDSTVTQVLLALPEIASRYNCFLVNEEDCKQKTVRRESFSSSKIAEIFAQIVEK